MKIFRLRHLQVCAYCLATLVIQGGGHRAYAEDSSYLDALQSEAEELSNFDQTQPTPNTPAEGASSEFAAKQVEFENTLQSELRNTYTIYRKLSPQQKALVVEAYFASGKKISVASRQIFNIYFQEGRK
jgi:hypothetical protein